MKLVKSLLLGSTAGLFAVAGAQAADLPARRAAPAAAAVEFVRVCSAYGTGFFFIPGTETCLRVSGRVRAEYRVQETFFRNDEPSGYRARARVNFDARTQTAYGTLRTFIRYELTHNGGAYGGDTTPSIVGINATVDLNKAFIQFAGITAGRATSFFDFYANDLNWAGSMGSDTYGFDPVLLAYTATLGQGFSATLSIEEPQARRVGGAGGLFTGFGGNQNNAIAATNLVYGPQRLPEIVGNLRLDQAWGSAQLSGALREVNSLNLVTVGTGPGAVSDFPESELGFAVQAGLKLNLPQIAPGDVLWLQAAYADGAVNYIGVGQNDIGRTLGTFQGGEGDAVIDPNGRIRNITGFNLTAAFLHYWTPEIRQAVFASYTELDVPRSVAAVATVGGAFPGAFASGAFTDRNIFQVGTNLIWSPVRDLDIGVEVFYERQEAQGQIIARNFVFNQAGVATAAPGVQTVGDVDRFQGRLRIQRDF